MAYFRDTERAEFTAQQIEHQDGNNFDPDKFTAAMQDYAPRYNPAQENKGSSAKPATGGFAIPGWMIFLIIVIIQIVGYITVAKFF